MNTLTLNSEQKARTLYIDILKTVAIFAVIIIHLTPFAFTSYPLLSPEYIFTTVLSCASRFCVPVFVMCSGAVFLNKNKTIATRKIYTKYIPRILYALILFALLYEAFNILLIHEKTGVWDFIPSINNILTFNTNFHLYYLYIIVLLYILVPPLKTFIKAATQRDCTYLLIFLFVAGTVLPFMRNFFPFNSYFGGMTLQYSLNLTYSMILYFFLGFYLSEFPLSKNGYITAVTLGICGVFVTFSGTTFLLYKKGTLDEVFLNSFSPFVCFMATAIFSLIKSKSVSANVNSFSSKFFTLISKSSFTIYLVHQFFNMWFNHIGINILSFTPFLSLPVLFTVEVTASVLLHMILKKIPFLRNIL